jgi:hypothetical protein
MMNEAEWLAELEKMGCLFTDEELQRLESSTSQNQIQALRGINETLYRVADYVDHGWSIVPQLPGQKQPRVKWKDYQSERPTANQLLRWFRRWPDAGPAVVLGTLSNLLVVDVDGEDAHKELLRRVGDVPTAPTVLSGSGKAYRYHLFFEHPLLPTKAKATPWHPNLEFRGQGGIVVAPPSLHKSGNRYRWASGRSLADIPLPPLPEAIVAALRERKRPGSICATTAPDEDSSIRIVPGISSRTRQFLSGTFAHSERWNSRLFGAACDMAGNGVPIERALPLLIAGAKPWDAQEEARAVTTIESAYSQPRVPASLLRTK